MIKNFIEVKSATCLIIYENNNISNSYKRITKRIKYDKTGIQRIYK